MVFIGRVVLIVHLLAAANTTEQAATFRGLTPGESVNEMAPERLGSPGREFLPGVTYFSPGPAGVAEALAAHGEDEILRWLWLRLEGKLPLGSLRAALGLVGAPVYSPGHPFDSLMTDGRSARYPMDGALVYKRDGMAREIVLFDPDADQEAVAREMEAVIRKLASPEHSPDALTAQPVPRDGVDVVAERPQPADPDGEIWRPADEVSVGDRPLTRLQILMVRVEHAVLDDGTQGLGIQAHVEADGLSGEELTTAVSLRLPDGLPVRAAASAPPQCRGPGGEARAESRDSIRYDSARWLPFRLFLPYDYLLLPENVRRVTVAFDAACAGFTAAMSVEATVPSLAGGEVPPRRAIALGAVDMVGDTLPDGRDALRITATLEAAGMTGETMTLAARLLHSGDRRFLAGASAGDMVRFEPARWEAFRILIPRDALPLPPGRPQRVVLELTARCGRLSGRMEQEFILVPP